MSRLAATAMESATQALLHADLVLAEQAITDGVEITTLGSYVEEDALAVLALRAPIAGDLRTIVSAIQIANDICGMGTLACHVAKIVRSRHPQRALPPGEIRKYFSEMSGVAVELGHGAGDVLLSHDPRIAAHMRQEDKAMDDLLGRLFTLTDHEWRHGVVAAVDVTLLGRFYRRFANHAVEVARRVITQTGRVTDDESCWPAAETACFDTSRRCAELSPHPTPERRSRIATVNPQWR